MADKYRTTDPHGNVLFSDGSTFFDERNVCRYCQDQCRNEGKPYQWADPRQSFGCYAGRYCDRCWPKSGYRDAVDDTAEFDPLDAGESLEAEDY